MGIIVCQKVIKRGQKQTKTRPISPLFSQRKRAPLPNLRRKLPNANA